MQRKLNDSFIDKYCSAFSEKISSVFFENKGTITGKEILSITPSKQVNFFILKILFTSWQEEMKKLESPYFNFKDAEVRKAMIGFMNSLSQKIEVDKTHFTPLLREALRDTLGLIAVPADYLEMELNGRGEQIISEKWCKTFLKYVKLFKPEFEEIMVESLGQTADQMIVEARAYFEPWDVEETAVFELSVLSEIEPISINELFDVEEEPEEPELPDFEVKEEQEEEGESFEVPAEEVIEEELEDELEEESEAYQPIDVEDELVEKEEVIETESTLDEKVELEPEETTEDPDQEEIVEEELKEEDIEPEPVPLNERLAEPPSRTVNENFERGDQPTLANQLEQTKVSSILEAISVNNRYMFIKELFEGDKDQFSKAIENLESCESFDDAVEMLVQKYAKDLDWDMNSDEVKELLKVIFRKFR